MSEHVQPNCPECDADVVDRRDFFRRVAVGTAAVAAVGAPSLVSPLRTFAQATAAPAAAAPVVKAPRPAEALIRELYTGMTAEQRRDLVLPYDHGGANLTRHGIFNAPIQGKRIGQSYTRPQQELVQRIVRAMISDEEGMRRISRNGTWDSSGSFEGNGAMIFGEPTEGRPFAFVFAGHHLTIRCDGDSEANTAFGGPIYYGHSVEGKSPRNVYHYQTRAVESVFESLSEAQRRTAVVTGSPGEGAGSIRFRGANDRRPGLSASELTAAQRQLVELVMREVLSPFRREDGNEVMDIIRRSGGMERINLAFYRDRDTTDVSDWHFWRLEGPGFVWNYRIMPHVHTFVNIAVRS